jgi:hypothetical protein
MIWNEIYDQGKMPSQNDIREFIGPSKQLWDELIDYIEKTYHTKPLISYSSCSAQPGWNIKYKKAGKSLCTLYPMDGYFIALVVVGNKEEDEVKIGMETGLYTAYLKELYEKTVNMKIGRWLMIEVKDQRVLKDIKRLIDIRIRLK